MKTKYFKIMIIFIGLIFISSIKVNAVEIKNQIKIDKLIKYEMVFLYPEGQQEAVEDLKDQVKEIYNYSLDNLIITEKLYDTNYCNKRVIVDLGLQGDIGYKTIVFAFVNNDMCEHIIYSLQNTNASCRHIEGVSRMKVITIPTEEEAQTRLNEWKQGKEDWLNYKYEENPAETINEVFEELDTTKEEFERAKDIYENGYNSLVINNNSNNENSSSGSGTSGGTSNSGNIVTNGNFEITHTISGIDVILSDGTVLNPELKTDDLDEKTKSIYLDSELMHGATLVVRNEVAIKNGVDELKDIELTYKTNENKKFSNINDEWDLSDDSTKLTIPNVELDTPLIIETTQVITIGSEINYQNSIEKISYTKIIRSINPDTGDEEITEIPEEIEPDLKSENIIILSEQ